MKHLKKQLKEAVEAATAAGGAAWSARIITLTQPELREERRLLRTVAVRDTDGLAYDLLQVIDATLDIIVEGGRPSDMFPSAQELPHHPRGGGASLSHQ